MAETEWHKKMKARHEENGFLLEYHCKLPDGRYFRFDAYKEDSPYAIREFVHSLSASYIEKAKKLIEVSDNIVWIFDGDQFEARNWSLVSKHKKRGDVEGLASADASRYISQLTKLNQTCILDCGDGYVHLGQNRWRPLEYDHPLRSYMQYAVHARENVRDAKEKVVLYLRAQGCLTERLQSDEEILAVASLVFGVTASSFADTLAEMAKRRREITTDKFYNKKLVRKNIADNWAYLNHIWGEGELSNTLRIQKASETRRQEWENQTAKNKLKHERDIAEAAEKKAARKANLEKQRLIQEAAQAKRRLPRDPRQPSPKPKEPPKFELVKRKLTRESNITHRAPSVKVNP